MIKAIFETNMEAMPKSCKDCTFEICSLPLKYGRDEIQKKYFTKRHKDCPLVEYKDWSDDNEKTR